MKEWILSVVGIVFVCVLIEIIMPEGKLNSFIKQLFGLFVLFVVVNPIANFLSNANTFVGSDVVIDSNYIFNVNLNKVDELEKLIIEHLEIEGISNVGVVVNCNVFNEDFKVDSVYVDVTNSSHNLNKEKLYSVVKNKVVKISGVGEGDVKIYG